MAFRKAPPVSAEPKPLPFQPWTMPPLGSLGDEWDTRMELPKDAATAAREDQQRQAAEAAAAKLRRKIAPIRELRQQLHRGVITAWVFNAMALTSVGVPQVTLLRQPFAVLAFLSAAAAIWLLKTITPLERGIGQAIAAMVVAVAILVASFVLG